MAVAEDGKPVRVVIDLMLWLEAPELVYISALIDAEQEAVARAGLPHSRKRLVPGYVGEAAEDSVVVLR